MRIPELVEKYFEQIEVEDTAFVSIDDAVSNATYLLLNIPAEMLIKYQELEGSGKRLPDGAEFWKKTGLVTKLRNSAKYQDVGRERLNDILDYLEGNVWGSYQELNTPNRIRLDITEIPEFH